MTQMNFVGLEGMVATSPRNVVTEGGLEITTFRFVNGVGTDQPSNWVTVTLYGKLSTEYAPTLDKGQWLRVYGELQIRDWDNGERSGTNVEVKACTVTRIQRPQEPEVIVPKHQCNCNDCPNNEE